MLLILVACRDSGSGNFTARWIVEQDTISFRAPMTASWCGARQRLDLLALRGDSGIGLALYPADSAQLVATYSVTEPGGPIQIRPGAGVAIRWFGKTLVQGFWGRQGTVTVTRNQGGRVDLSIDAQLVSSVLGSPGLALTGRAGGIPIEVDSACGKVEAAPAPGPVVPGPAAPDPDAREID